MHERAMDNAVAESFFNLLKRERIRRRTYKTREQARQDIFASHGLLHKPLPADGLHRNVL